MVNLISPKRVNHIKAKGGYTVWLKGSKFSGFSTVINNRLSDNRADYILRLLEQRGVDSKKVLKVSEGGIDRFNPDEANRHTKIELHIK